MRRFAAAFFSIALLSLVLFPAGEAAAHQTGKSTFVVHVKPAQNAVDTVLTFPAIDLADHLGLDEDEDGRFSPEELATGRPKMLDYLEKRIGVEAGGEPCETVERRANPLASERDRMVYLQAFECASLEGQVTIRNVAMTEMRTGYSHIGRIQVGESEEVVTTAFSGAFPTYELGLDAAGDEEEKENLWDLLLRFLWQGVVHIVLGLDHVLFVVALILVARDFKQLLGVVTAFTISHSITLAVASLGVVTLPAHIIEPIIAASILYVAFEAWFKEAESKRIYATTFILGLVHGFGFSYVLAEVGLPTDDLLPALFSFNVGVELGQLAFVLALWPLRRYAIDKPWERRAVRVIAVVLAAVALYWLVTRVVSAVA